MKTVLVFLVMRNIYMSSQCATVCVEYLYFKNRNCKTVQIQSIVTPESRDFSSTHVNCTYFLNTLFTSIRFKGLALWLNLKYSEMIKIYTKVTVLSELLNWSTVKSRPPAGDCWEWPSSTFALTGMLLSVNVRISMLNLIWISKYLVLVSGQRSPDECIKQYVWFDCSFTNQCLVPRYVRS